MNKELHGKELILKTINLEKTHRAPWVPFVGVHGAALIGKNAKEYLQSEQYIIEAASHAINLYNVDGIPVTFDLQIEAEILGCKLIWADDNPPAVCSHPLADGVSLEELKIPSKTDGRIPLVIGATQQLRNKFPEIALYGLITGPFTLALHLLGTEAFIQMFTEPEKLHQTMAFACEVAKKMAAYYLEAGADIIGVVDPMTSQIAPEQFEEFVSPYSTDLFEHIRETGGKGSFFVCGNAKQNIEVMCQCKPDNVSIDENIPLDYVRDIALSHQISFGGNLKLTVALLMGTKEEAGRDAIECIDTGGTTGFILAPGCDLAMSTPVGNLEYVSLLAHDKYQRDVLKAKAISKGKYHATDISKRFNANKVIVDIITLDSSSCAPCQYMVEAVDRAIKEIDSEVSYFEHRIKDKEGVEMMMALGVQNLPTIAINGNVKFISQIPPKEELINAIKEFIPN